MLPTLAYGQPVMPLTAQFKQLCFDTRAKQAAVYLAAERAGWRPVPPREAGQFQSLSGSASAREFKPNTPAYRGVTAGTVKANGQVFDRCLLMSRDAFPQVMVDMQKMFLTPKDRSASAWGWQVAVVNGRVLPATRDLFRGATQPERLMSVFAYPIKGGTMLELNEIK